MRQIQTLSIPLAVTFGLVATLLSLAGQPPAPKSADGREAEGQRVRKYTKVWTDDYHNHNKEVYLAYTKTLKDEKGVEYAVEIRHGKATGFHKNGNKFWEVEYRHGKAEGEFTNWAENGTRTALMTCRNGLGEGKYLQWNRDGRKMREEIYEKGKLNGEARWWDGDGKLLTTGTYRDGVPWDGTFPELESPPGENSRWVIRRYEDGKKVSQEKLTGNWW
ncbi:MAG TPA: hypothetical protein VH643_23670 [Gemmataceae bacterium]|jgi:hypothetical protein